MGMLPVERLTPGEIMNYQQFLNGTLDNIDRLRYPFSFPSLQPPQDEDKSTQNEARTAARELHRELVGGADESSLKSILSSLDKGSLGEIKKE